MAFRLRPDKSVPRLLKRILREQIDQARAEIASRRPRAEAVHQVRRRCKKIRSVLRLLRPGWGRQYRQENNFFRNIARDLAALRDTEVMVATFETLLAEGGKRLDRRHFTLVRRRLAQARQRTARDRRAGKEELLRAAERLKAARKRVKHWQLAGRNFAAIAGGLKQTYSRTRTARRQAYAKPNAEHFHEFRIRVKDHRHHIQLLREIWPPALEARARELKELARLLGDEHDLAVFRSWVVAEGRELRRRDLQALLDLIKQRSDALRATARPFGERLFAEPPKYFCRRMRQYWETTRAAAKASTPVRPPPRKN